MTSGSDKFLSDQMPPHLKDSLAAWFQMYFRIHVNGSAAKTRKAKLEDLGKFFRFFHDAVRSDHVDAWTPSVSKIFQSQISETISGKTGRRYAPTTVNRIMASVRHFGGWLHSQRPLIAGHPLEGVRDTVTDHPDWKGLDEKQIIRLKSAIDQRLKACTRNDQNPLMEATVFYILLHTGLREAELCNLDFQQYHHRGFHEVARKGRRVQRKIPVPKEAREYLDQYILECRGAGPGPLLMGRYGERLSPDSVQRICKRLARQASAHLAENDRFHFHPHQLRHTFLKRMADRYGVHVAQTISGNVSTSTIFRYVKPSTSELERDMEDLFEP